MNKGIAHILLDKLKSLPFIDLYGGLVQTIEQVDDLIDDETGANSKQIQLYPATSDYYHNNNWGSGDLKDFSPSSDNKGILFFEDMGTESKGRDGRLMAYLSKLRLICWLNTEGIRKDLIDNNEVATYDLPAMMMSSISGKMVIKNFINTGIYLKLIVKERSILSQDKSIFSRYTFDTAATQFLMPPYEFFAVDYSIDFCISPNCISNLKRVNTTC